MPYVRERMQPAGKTAVQARVESRRYALSVTTGRQRFYTAYDWFRAAAVYARRRSYRTTAIAETATARLERITEDAARMLQEHADQLDALIPASFRRQTRRADIREGYARARTAADRMNAAHSWLLFMARQAERHSPGLKARAAGIQDDATAKLIAWAEEVDRDDYGE